MKKAVSRRRVLAAGAALYPATMATAAKPQRQPKGSLTDVPGIKVGQFTNEKGTTGCTVIVAAQGAVAGVDVRGGAPGTRETDLLKPEMTVQQVHAVVLSGGSAFGLASADGVMRYLEEQSIGYKVGANVVPIVPAAILFDLGRLGSSERPTAEFGYKAAKAATTDAVAQGNVGAGAGATIGKLLGPGRGMKGGLGSASLSLPGGLILGAIVAVNAVGDVVDPDTGAILAGARNSEGPGFADTSAVLRSGAMIKPPGAGENTTIGVIAANVDWSRAQAIKVAQMAHDGYARAIRPAHMPMDGDTIFALGTGGRSVDSGLLGQLGALAADVMAQAVVAAILHANGIEGFPSFSDL